MIHSQLSHKTQSDSSDVLFLRGGLLRKFTLVGAETRAREGWRQMRPNKNKTCNYCKLKGHIKKDCWKWNQKNSSHKGARDRTSNADASYINDSDDGGVLVTTYGVQGWRWVDSWLELFIPYDTQ